MKAPQASPLSAASTEHVRPTGGTLPSDEGLSMLALVYGFARWRVRAAPTPTETAPRKRRCR